MATLTLKNIPAELHARLKANAEQNRRSLTARSSCASSRTSNVPRSTRRCTSPGSERSPPASRVSITRKVTRYKRRAARDRRRQQPDRAAGSAGPEPTSRSAYAACRSRLAGAVAVALRGPEQPRGGSCVTAASAMRGARPHPPDRRGAGGRRAPASDAVLNVVERSRLSAYDAEFVALADGLGVPLVTEDKAIVRAFPALAMTMEAFLER